MDRVFGLVPDIHDRFRDMERAVWDPPVLDPALLELARLRIAQLLRATGDLRFRHRPAMDAGLSEEKIAALRDWPTSPLFTEAERAVLSFTEVYVMDAHAVDDEQCARLNACFSGNQLAGLSMALAIFDATVRFRAALGIHPDGDGVLLVDPT
jgi:alkylhydroperoxidase family enzyme